MTSVLCWNVCNLDTITVWYACLIIPCTYPIAFFISLSSIQMLKFALLNYCVSIMFGRIGIRWVFQFIRLGLYALFLMPGFIQGICSTHFFLDLMLLMIGLLYTVFDCEIVGVIVGTSVTVEKHLHLIVNFR